MFTKNLLRNLKTCSFIGFKLNGSELVFQWKRSFSNRAYINQIGKEPLIYRNLGEQILKNASIYGNRTALIACEENIRYTYDEVLTEAEKLAVQLQELGLKRGEHLGIWAPNVSQWYISLFAATLGGFPLVCLNPALQAPELEYALKKSKSKVLITMKEYGMLNFSKVLDELFRNGETKFPDLRLVIVERHKSQDRSNQYDYDELLKRPIQLKQIKELEENVPKISPESPFVFQLTSGTTGQPKIAVLTHFNFVNETLQLGEMILLKDSQKKVCLMVPLFHVFGLGLTIASIQHGSTIVLPSLTYNVNAILDSIEKESCNALAGTPTMYVDLIKQQRMNPRCTKTLELAYTGGAACSPEVIMQIKQYLTPKEIRIGYGSTETSFAIFAQDGTESIEQAILSVGRPLDHVEAKVINDKGETVEFGVNGELCVRGYFVMKGYYEDEARTKEVLSSDGWYRTGDEFILESTGLGRVMGRKKEMIIRGGENIFPKEIEDFLDTHESVLEAQVIGVPDKRLGEEVCVFLRLKPDAKPLTAADIKSFCKGKLAYFKIPRYVQIVDEFPKTRTGKIQKFKLKDMLKI